MPDLCEDCGHPLSNSVPIDYCNNCGHIPRKRQIIKPNIKLVEARVLRRAVEILTRHGHMGRGLLFTDDTVTKKEMLRLADRLEGKK